MANPNWQPSHAIAEIARLTASGVLGFYTHFEATEVFAIPDGEAPFNVFSILVAEERSDAVSEETRFLNSTRIKLQSLKGWTFGIKRYCRPISALAQAFTDFNNGSGWRPSGQPLQVGNLTPIPTQFVPPDSMGEVPWNRVLKNNFWSGSHVIEWADLKKTALQPLFDDPPRLQELSNAVRHCVPISLASLSDRLGNIAIQLPVTVVIAQFKQIRATATFFVDLRWHSNAIPRPLRAACELDFDKAISGYSSASVQAPSTLLPMPPGQGLHRGVLWDDQHQVVLTGTGDCSFVHTIVTHFRPMDPEPRVFTVCDNDGNDKEIRIGLMSEPVKSVVGQVDDDMEWTRRRMYHEEAARLATERRFVQYWPEPGQQMAKHETALCDIRQLINQNGEKGAWLWDPYLSAQDVLSTLFYCSHANSDLRALTAGNEVTFDVPSKRDNYSLPSRLRACLRSPFVEFKPPPAPLPTFAQKQRAILENTKSNLRGLRLEYRVKTGSAGWGFHDRFLIFPQTDRGALAWSLGTSVNSLGKQHHILQRVDDGQLVMDAFTELWDQLNQPEHLIWKVP